MMMILDLKGEGCSCAVSGDVVAWRGSSGWTFGGVVAWRGALLEVAWMHNWVEVEVV